ncbi:MAG: flagellar motor protein MotB [candidate division Zixibacteria bacterium]|nr:flagellar motor protein MotB [candidate division Zixibacteria bacterium]
MADDTQQEPTIIIKRKGGHGGGHHGGSWKVAYADFVTSMMAFFLVMWLIAQSETVRESVAGYFQNPTGFKKGGDQTVLPNKGTSVIEMKSKNMMTEEQIRKMREKEARERLKEAAAEIMKKLRENPSFERLKNQIEVQMTAEGLRIQLLESSGESFFERGSAELKPFTKQMLVTVAEEIARLPNKVIIEGHTDSYQYAEGATYTNWELSVDRCNSARRWMKEHGLRLDQVAEVRGYAATQPKVKADPANPSNRRIAIIVQNEFSGLNYLDKNVIVEDKEITQPDSVTTGSAPTSAVDNAGPPRPMSASSE